MCGFRDAITFKNVDEKTIDYVENYIQTELTSVLDDMNTKENEMLLNKVDFFGNIHILNPTLFKFSLGERIQILEIAAFVKQTLDGTKGDKPNSGNSFFSVTRKRKKLNFKGLVNYPNFGRYYSNQNAFFNIQKSVEPIIGIQTDDLQSKLFHDIVFLLKSVKTNEETILKLEKDIVSVNINDDGTVTGKVKCIFCSEEKRKKVLHSVPSKREGDKIYWTTMNYRKHIVNIHKMVEDNKKLKPKQQKNNDNKKITEKRMDGSNNMNTKSSGETPKAVADLIEKSRIKLVQHVVDSTIKDVEHTEEVVIVNSFEECFEEASTNILNSTEKNNEAAARTIISVLESDDSQNEADSLFENGYSVHLIIEPVDNPHNDSIESLQSEIYRQISSQMIEMMQASHINDEEELNMEFVCADETKLLKIVSIEGDGNCLYSTIIHQLKQKKLGSDIHNTLTENLRIHVVSFIKANFSIFEKEIQGRVYDRTQIDDITDMEKECGNFLDYELPFKTTFGGSETIKAVVLMFKVNILIINEKGDLYFANDFNSSYSKTLVLAYKLSGLVVEPLDDVSNSKNTTNQYRNHYDSVVNIDAEQIFSITRHIVSRRRKRNSYDPAESCVTIN